TNGVQPGNRLQGSTQTEDAATRQPQPGVRSRYVGLDWLVRGSPDAHRSTRRHLDRSTFPQHALLDPDAAGCRTDPRLRPGMALGLARGTEDSERREEQR